MPLIEEVKEELVVKKEEDEKEQQENQPPSTKPEGRQSRTFVSFSDQATLEGSFPSVGFTVPPSKVCSRCRTSAAKYYLLPPPPGVPGDQAAGQVLRPCHRASLRQPSGLQDNQGSLLPAAGVQGGSLRPRGRCSCALATFNPPASPALATFTPSAPPTPTPPTTPTPDPPTPGPPYSYSFPRWPNGWNGGRRTSQGSRSWPPSLDLLPSPSPLLLDLLLPGPRLPLLLFSPR